MWWRNFAEKKYFVCSFGKMYDRFLVGKYLLIVVGVRCNDFFSFFFSRDWFMYVYHEGIRISCANLESQLRVASRPFNNIYNVPGNEIYINCD